MNGNGQTEHRGRETRLLLLVIVIALGVLFVLARFRFPSVEGTVVVPPSPGPLERLAARDTLDDVGGTIQGLTQRLAAWLAVVRTDPPAPAKPKTRTPAPPAEPSDVRWLSAVRVRPDIGLVYVAASRTIGFVVDSTTAIQSVAADEAREVALVRLPFSEGLTMPAPFETYEGFSYVAVIEASAGGISARPVFLGRVDRESDPRWSDPVMVLAGRTGIVPGDLIFSFGGLFIGLAVEHADGLAIVPPSALEAAVTSLLGGGGVRAP